MPEKAAGPVFWKVVGGRSGWRFCLEAGEEPIPEEQATFALGAVNACIALNPQNPELVAPEIPGMKQLLDDAKELFEMRDECSDPDRDEYIWLKRVELLLKRIGDTDGS